MLLFSVSRFRGPRKSFAGYFSAAARKTAQRRFTLYGKKIPFFY